MARHMSCSLTIDAVRERRKTVTRRHVDTWKTLKAGDRLTLIEKGMGLPAGSKQVVLAEVEVVDVRVELVSEVNNSECVLEGFPEMMADEFLCFWLKSYGYPIDPSCWEVECRRIEWRYLDEEASDA